MRVVDGDVEKAIEETTLGPDLTSGFFVDVDDSKANGRFLYTRGAAVCTLLAAYNSKTSNGFLGHFLGTQRSEATRTGDGSYPGPEAFDEALDHVWAVMRPFKAVSVLLAGCGVEYDGQNFKAITDPEREHTVQRLVDIGISRANINTQWTDVPDTAMNAHLNCYEGVLTLEYFPSSLFMSISANSPKKSDMI